MFGKYDLQAAKPLEIPAEFTYRVRNWAVKPYTELIVQNSPCSTPYEPLFVRHWSGTDKCTDFSCALQPAIEHITQTEFNFDVTNQETDQRLYICAKRGGASYLNATHADDAGVCPD